MESGYLDRNGSFQTHYLEWKPEHPNDKLPVICVHGVLANARMYQWVGDLLSSGGPEQARRVIAVDIRGCGDSGMPESGFALADMASDIAAVMDHLAIRLAHIIGYSRGVSYALHFARENPGRVRGVVVGDYPPFITRLTEEWLRQVLDGYREYESWAQLYERFAAPAGIPKEEFDKRKGEFFTEQNGVIRKRYMRELPAKLQQVSADVDLAPALDAVGGPLLILKGKKKNSLLSEEQLAGYLPYHPEVVRVEGVGHDVFEPVEQVKLALLNFFGRVE